MNINLLKGRFGSGLEGASAIQQIGNLTGKQPCELMHNNHNQMKIWFEIIRFKNSCKINRECSSKTRGSPTLNSHSKINPNVVQWMDWGIFWHLICFDCVPCMLAPNLRQCWIIGNTYPLKNQTRMNRLYINRLYSYFITSKFATVVSQGYKLILVNS